MAKLIKGLVDSIKKFFGGIFSAILKGGSALGGKKKAKPPEQK
jgi:hypothetical protein